MKAGVSTTKRMAKAVAVMGSGTLISRVLGLIRLTLIVAILGSSTRQVDIFWIANLIPNTLLLFLAGGVLNTVLVPQITRAIKKDKDGGEAFVNRILTAFVIGIGLLTVLLSIASPVLLEIYVSDDWRTPELVGHYSNMLLLTYLCVPQLFFYGMFFLLSQILNARDQFAPGMWAPILNNIISIFVFFSYWVIWADSDTSAPFTYSQILLLGVGSTLGIVAQFLVLLPYMRRTGFKFRPRFDLRGTGLGRVFSLAKWTIYFVAVNQLVLIVIQRLASSATAKTSNGAGMTVYSTAEMLWLLPHSLITVSLATAMLSSASRLAAEKNDAGVAIESMQTIKFALIVLAPASAIFLFFAHPISRLLFSYGSGSTGVGYIGTTLMAFSFGLVPYTIQFVCNRTYYALEDTRTAFFLQLRIAILNAILAFVFVTLVNDSDWVAPSLAAAVSLANFFGVIFTVKRMQTRLRYFKRVEILRFAVKLLIISVIAAAIAKLIFSFVAQFLGNGLLGDLFGGSVAAVIFFAGFYYGTKILRITEVTKIVENLRKRKVTPSETANEDEKDPEQETTNKIAEITPDSIPEIKTTDKLTSIVESGQLLSHRYSLREQLSQRGNIETWLALDEVLERLVLIYLLPTNTPRLEHILVAARKGAAATESRFLRVLDASEELNEDAGLGGYVVCEYVHGKKLEELLANGAISSLEGAWIVREVGDAMVSMHAKGLFHERLNPDTILITGNGNVKIMGFGVESALANVSDIEESWPQREKTDVHGLGKVLYACLVNRWPGEDAWGMTAAPVDDDGNLLMPRQFRQDVPTALDSICDRVLSETPQRGESLRTADGIVTALNSVLGNFDASGDLEHRLRYPVLHGLEPMVLVNDVVLPNPVGEAVTAAAAAEPRPEVPEGHRTPTERHVQFEGFSGVRQWPLFLTGIVLLTLIVAIIVSVGYLIFGPEPAPQPIATTSPEQQVLQPIQIVSVSDFDPDGDNKIENPELAPLVIDDSKETGWRTENYGSADLGTVKSGVGLILDLGEVKSISKVLIDFDKGPVGIELRVPVVRVPGKSSADWKPVLTDERASANAELTLDEKTETRYVLLWLTSLPPAGNGRFEAQINDVEVIG